MTLARQVEKFERQVIERELEKYGIQKASERLGIHQNTLLAKRKRYGFHVRPKKSVKPSRIESRRESDEQVLMLIAASERLSKFSGDERRA